MSLQQNKNYSQSSENYLGAGPCFGRSLFYLTFYAILYVLWNFIVTLPFAFGIGILKALWIPDLNPGPDPDTHLDLDVDLATTGLDQI